MIYAHRAVPNARGVLANLPRFDSAAIARLGAAIRSEPNDQWPFAVARAGRELEREISVADRIRVLGAEINAIAYRHGCVTVAGASTIGTMLAGAAVGASENGLRFVSPEQAGESVLIVDSLLASGVQMTRAVRTAHAAGAEKVVGLVVLADQEGLAACRRNIKGEVIALAEF